MIKRIKLMLVAVLVCMPALGLAQTIDGIITGRVEDSSGGRIPGVSISITSPSLLGERTAVSDEGGNYRFSNLSPGNYRVKYELPGFKTLIREGIIVEVGKTVTLTITMEVSSVAETVTVTGESPVVDVEQANIGVNFSSSMKDSVVNSRAYWALLSVTPGIKTTTPDVGGSTMGTQVGYRAYGRTGQVQVALDGVNSTEGSGAGPIYGDYQSWQEVQVAAAGNSAEMNTGGTSVVAVIRSGGNDIHSTAFVSYQKDSFQSNNITDKLRNQGITVGDKFTRYTDLNFDIGGPIKKDKFWYYGSFRDEYSGLKTELRQNDGARYRLPASGIAPALCSQLPCVGDNPDGGTRGAIFYTRLRNYTTKLTYQLSTTNQLTATANVILKYQPYRDGQGATARFLTADTTRIQDSWFHIAKFQWVSTLSNRTTLDVSLNNWGYYWPNHRWVEEPRIFDRGSSGPTRSYTQGGYRANLTNRRRWHENLVLSHFFDGLGGSHSLKSGYVLQWEDNREGSKGYVGHVRYIFENGIPNRIDVENTPVQWSQHALLQNSFYVTDKWQIRRRLTANVGFRFDRYTSYLPEQFRESAGANPFNLANDIPGLETFGNQKFASRTVARFNNPVPRLAVIYDLFGNGKTAIKATYGRFSINPADDLASDLQLNEVRTATYTWNGTMPFTPDYLRRCLADASCSVLTQPSLAVPRIDPNLRNSYITEFTAGIDHELFKDWNLRFNFVRKIDDGEWDTINENYAITDYAPFQFRDVGRDGVAETADDAIVTAYNRAVATRPADNLIAFKDGSGDMYRTWEVEVVKRLSNKWQLITGADWTKRDFGADLFTTNPNTVINEAVIGGTHYWEWTTKLAATYEFPYGIRFASTYKGQKGESSNRTINVNCNRVLPAGQTCSQAGGRAPGQGSFDLTVEPSGKDKDGFLPSLHLWDVQVAKVFDMERTGDIEANFALFNITNASTIRSWTSSSATTQNLDGSTVPTFHRPTLILNPRIFRLGLKWSF